MKLSKQIRNSYDRANPISQLLCLYVLPFLRKNYRKEIEPDSFEPNSNCHDCDRLSGQLRKEWLRQVNSHKSPSIIRALFRTFWKTYSAMTIEHIIIYAIFRMLMPLILGRIIFHSELYLRGRTLGYAYNGNAKSSNDQLITWLGLNSHQSIIFYCVLLAVLILVNILTAQPYFMMKSRLGMRIRIALTRLIYEKAFVVTNQTVQRNTVGKIVNLISNDASRFDYMFVYFESSYMAIPVTTVAIIYLYLYIGRSTFGTLLMVLFYVPFQAIMANILTRIRTMAILLTDDRLRLMSEILPAMRVIKMYVWEKPFSRLVHLARKNEVQKIRHSMFMRSINLALFFVSSKVMALVCIILFILDDGVLSAEVVFVTLSLVNQIREVTTNMCPNGVSSGVETYISLKRIEKFLLETEIVENRLIEQEKTKIKTGIVLNNVSVKSSSDGTPILNNISFEAKHGKLTIIIGQVGSGKSSVLLSILNELPRTSGHIAINGTMIYVSQESWIFNGTVRENILFGREFNVRKYEEALKVSALVDDLKQFENGDRTMVDDRGTSLSGGQRARISLARALYTDSDCYLLDDPLSAVDASVAKHIFERCIMEYLRHKCVILVTHQLQFIKQADQIIVMKDGACHAIGSYQDLLDQGFGRFLCSATESHDDDDNNDRISAQIKAQRMRVESYTSERSNSISSYLGSIHSSVQEQPICTMNTIEEGSNRMNLSVPKQINYMDLYSRWCQYTLNYFILFVKLFNSNIVYRYRLLVIIVDKSSRNVAIQFIEHRIYQSIDI
ncbi:Multidrug resistance-associated protein 4 [Blomia tropicalis]|nr:Multidrug resistance-associated protein 4 [Blomia tropicalis]